MGSRHLVKSWGGTRQGRKYNVRLKYVKYRTGETAEMNSSLISDRPRDKKKEKMHQVARAGEEMRTNLARRKIGADLKGQ